MIEVDDIVDMRNELLVLEKNIENTGLKKFSGQQKFSELTIQKLSLSNY